MVQKSEYNARDLVMRGKATWTPVVVHSTRTAVCPSSLDRSSSIVSPARDLLGTPYNSGDDAAFAWCAVGFHRTFHWDGTVRGAAVGAIAASSFGSHLLVVAVLVGTSDRCVPVGS